MHRWVCRARDSLKGRVQCILFQLSILLTKKKGASHFQFAVFFFGCVCFFYNVGVIVAAARTAAPSLPAAGLQAEVPTLLLVAVPFLPAVGLQAAGRQEGPQCRHLQATHRCRASCDVPGHGRDHATSTAPSCYGPDPCPGPVLCPCRNPCRFGGRGLRHHLCSRLAHLCKNRPTVNPAGNLGLGHCRRGSCTRRRTRRCCRRRRCFGSSSYPPALRVPTF